jgi:hypothetical protein
MTEFQLKSCVEATNVWQDDWIFCPVCLCQPNADGVWIHKDSKDLIQ